MRDNRTIGLVIPTLNEERNLRYVLKSIPGYIDEVIVVDGHSKDKTVEVAKQHGCILLYDSKGKGSALRRGMQHAKSDIIITMDADCSMLPSEICLLVAGIEAGYDVCMGSRFLQGGGTDDMPFYRKIGNKVLVQIVNLFWKTNYSDLCYGYRAVRKEVIKKLNLKKDGFGIETELSIHAARLKLKTIEVPSFEKQRKYGKGNLRTLRDGWVILMTIVDEIFK